MKHLLKTSFLAIVCAGLLFASCKKDENNPSLTDEVALAANADDESSLSSEQDAALEDVDQLFNSTSLAGGRVDFTQCGATVDSSVPNQRTLTYDGVTACGPRNLVRSGSIVVRLFNAVRWRDAGAILHVTFNNYGVKRPNGNILTYNGTGKVYNVLGGLRKDIPRGIVTNVQHRIRMNNIAMTYKNKAFTWSFAKTRTYSANGDLYSITITGDTTIAGNANLGSWGTGRFGELFYTQFQQPIVANSSCGFAAPISGKKFHNGLRRDLTVTFGVDQSGNPQSTGCPYGYKYEFVGIARTVTGIVAY